MIRIALIYLLLAACVPIKVGVHTGDYQVQSATQCLKQPDLVRCQ